MLGRPAGFWRFEWKVSACFARFWTKLEWVKGFSQRLEKSIFMKLSSAVLALIHEDRRTETKWRNQKTHFCSCVPRTHPVTEWMFIAADYCLQRDRVIVMLSVLLYSIFTVKILYKLYSVQLNCTYSNYTGAGATCPAAQEHSTFTVQTVQSPTELYLR